MIYFIKMRYPQIFCILIITIIKEYIYKNSNNEEEVRMAYALAKLSDMRARRNENR